MCERIDVMEQEWRQFKTTGKVHLVDSEGKWRRSICGCPVRTTNLEPQRSAFEAVEYRGFSDGELCKTCKKAAGA